MSDHVPGTQSTQLDIEIAPTVDDHVPALQEMQVSIDAAPSEDDHEPYEHILH